MAVENNQLIPYSRRVTCGNEHYSTIHYSRSEPPNTSGRLTIQNGYLPIQTIPLSGEQGLIIKREQVQYNRPYKGISNIITYTPIRKAVNDSGLRLLRSA